MASSWGLSWGTSWGSSWGTGAPAQPTPTIVAPQVRSIDAKTLADHFNRGLVATPDYEWPNSRKFFQGDEQ